MEGEAEAADILHAADLEAFKHPLLYLGDELGVGELARGFWVGMILLGDSHGEVQMNIQAELEQGFVRIDHGRGQRLAGHCGSSHCILVGESSRGYGLQRHGGFENVFFH